MRTIEVFVDGSWFPTDFSNLQVGDKFRIFDNGIRFIDAYGQVDWTVGAVPKFNEDGILYVETEEVTA